MYYLWLFWVFASARGLSLAVANGSYSLVVVQGLLIPVVSPVVEHGLCGVLALVVVVHRLCCRKACRIFVDQSWNSCPHMSMQILNHWSTREVPNQHSFEKWKYFKSISSSHKRVVSPGLGSKMYLIQVAI